MNNEIISFFTTFFSDFLIKAVNICLGVGVIFMVKKAVLNYIGGNKLVKEVNGEKIYRTDYIWVVLLWFVAMGYLYKKTSDLGWIGLLISILSGVIIVLVGWLILEEDEEEDNLK